MTHPAQPRSSARTSRSSWGALLGRPALAALVALSGSAAGAEPVLHYIPFAYATIQRSGGTDTPFSFTRWETIVQAFNTSSAPAVVTTAAIDGNGARLGDGPGCRHEVPLDAGTGALLIPCFGRYPEPGVAMLVVESPPGVTLRADVQKARFVCDCAGSGCVSVPQGQATLPVFRGLFPSGATAVSGPVELGNFDLPTTCASPNQVYRRRVNVTLYNGSDLPALFMFRVIPNQGSATPLSSSEVSVGPREVLQLNGIPVPTSGSPELRAVNDGSRVWILVSADRPFLSYATAIFDDPEPGALPFQVYPGAVVP